MTEIKEILDPACGGKIFYFDKNDPRILFCDCRRFEDILCDGRRLVVKPDQVVDFRNLPFADDSFSLVIFDPPHLRRVGNNSWMQKKYGKLPREEWKEYLAQCFHECWRVLAPHGTLVFKWNEHQITVSRIQDISPDRPIMGTRTKTETMFIIFHKTPNKMKTYVIMLSRVFPATHPKAAEPTEFKEKLIRKEKLHTIRANWNLWAERLYDVRTGKAVLSIRQWTGKPYRSKQVEIARLGAKDGVGVQRLSFDKDRDGMVSYKRFNVDGKYPDIETLAENDGLSLEDWKAWFKDYDLTQPMAVIFFTNFRY